MLSESYLLLCFGRTYIIDALDLFDTLRHFNDHRPINIVCLPEDHDFAKKFHQFNNIIIFDPTTDPLYSLCNTKFDKFGLLPKLRIPSFLQTDLTIVLDTDVICAYHTDDLWEYFLNKQQPLVMVGSKHNRSWHWGHWGRICDQIHIKPYETHSGMFFINKTDYSKIIAIWDHAIFAFKNFDKLGFLRFYLGNSVADEPCFAYAFNKSGIEPAEITEFPIITFDISAFLDNIPTNKLTYNNKIQIMNNYIPFIHMFSKNQSINFQLLKNKILNYA